MKITEKYLFFWQTNEIYSNWHPAKFEWNSITFDNSEAAFMYGKAAIFNDVETGKKIIKNQDPRSVKKLGREVKGFENDKWDI